MRYGADRIACFANQVSCSCSVASVSKESHPRGLSWVALHGGELCFDQMAGAYASRRPITTAEMHLAERAGRAFRQPPPVCWNPDLNKNSVASSHPLVEFAKPFVGNIRSGGFDGSILKLNGMGERVLSGSADAIELNELTAGLAWSISKESEFPGDGTNGCE